MNERLESIQLIDIDQVCFHEAHETTRLELICNLISEEGVVRNPPLVLAMEDGQYVILDGAHRTLAMKALNCRRIVAQVVGSEQLTIEAWCHLVSVGDWLEQLYNDQNLRWETTPDDTSSEQLLAEIVKADGSKCFVYPTGTELTALEAWHRIVKAYCCDHSVTRLPERYDLLPDQGEVLIRYPRASIEELKQIVANGHVMPAGVTRFLINGRVLNLRVPLHLLTDHTFVQEEWDKLRKHWASFLRLYSEPVYLCEA